MQRGSIEKRGNCWLLKYYEPVLIDGTVVKKQKAKKIATVSEKYYTKESVQHFADAILAPINAHTQPESAQTVEAFLEYVYLQHVKETKKPTTIKSYEEMFRLVKPFLGDLQMRAVRTSDIDRLMKAVANEKQRAHTTHRNLKSFLSGGFRYAKRTDVIRENPVRDSVVPRGKPRGETKAYTLEEIQQLLTVMPEPARTAVLVAAMTGLRVSEIKGLRWEDIVDDELQIRRSVAMGKVTDTKTLSSRAPVPLLPLVKKALQDHRKRTPGDGFIFHGNTGNPLRLENVLRRSVKPVLAEEGLEWYGWHAFRRGVATNLHMLGVDDKTIQNILRHSTVAVTQALYIKPVAKASSKAMKKLARAFKKAE
jgi:integrase